MAQTVEAFGHLDFAHNNAGVELQDTIVGTEEADWDRVIAVNLKGVWLGMKYQIPQMLEHGGGSIVNTASLAGLMAVPSLAAYIASKHGVVGLTRAAAVEVANDGIRVNCVCPAAIRTAMMDVLPEERQLELLAPQAMKRFGEPARGRRVRGLAGLRPLVVRDRDGAVGRRGGDGAVGVLRAPSSRCAALTAASREGVGGRSERPGGRTAGEVPELSWDSRFPESEPNPGQFAPRTTASGRARRVDSLPSMMLLAPRSAARRHTDDQASSAAPQPQPHLAQRRRRRRALPPARGEHPVALVLAQHDPRARRRWSWPASPRSAATVRSR